MKLVILDHDGVINFDSDAHIKSPEEWVPIPGSLEAIARLHRAEYKVVIASNQSGVGRGLFTMDRLNKIHSKMLDQLYHKGGRIEAIFFCPHAPEANCDCRKPAPGLLREISVRLHAPLHGVPCVGDSLRDLEAAREVSALPVLVRTGKGPRTLEKIEAGQAPAWLGEVPVYHDLAAFAEALLAGELNAQIEALQHAREHPS